VVVLLSMSVTLSTIAQQQQPRTNAQTTTTSTQIANFTQLFEQKFVSHLGAPPVRVVYQSPTTVILVGHAKILNTKIALVNNQQLYHFERPVDTILAPAFNALSGSISESRLLSANIIG
jgi:hypothetical protein